MAEVLGLRLEGDVGPSVGNAEPYIALLVRVRDDLRAAKQWALADRIRDELAQQGIAVEDGPTGSTWSRRKA